MISIPCGPRALGKNSSPGNFLLGEPPPSPQAPGDSNRSTVWRRTAENKNQIHPTANCKNSNPLTPGGHPTHCQEVRAPSLPHLLDSTPNLFRAKFAGYFRPSAHTECKSEFQAREGNRQPQFWVQPKRPGVREPVQKRPRCDQLYRNAGGNAPKPRKSGHNPLFMRILRCKPCGINRLEQMIDH